MAHKLDYSKGKAAFISYQAPAWHGLGKVFNQEISIEQALKESGLDFHVDKLPNIHRLGNGTEVVSDSSFFTVRTDVQKVLGTRLGPDYTVYQNIEALDIVDELLKTKKIIIETVGAIDEGKKVFTCLKLTNSIAVDGTDEIFQYVLLTNSHDGSLAITAMPTNVRVVCANTLSAALAGAKGAHKIRHTKNAADRVKEAFTIMGLLEDNSKANAAAYNAMKYNGITKQEFFDYIGNIFITSEEINNLQKGEKDVLSTRKQNTIGEVLQFANNGIGQAEALGDSLNMWYAYNAVTGYLTSKKYGSADDRFESLMIGDSAKKINAAGELALAPHNIRPLKANASKIAGMNQNFN
jgi:phage/plasmid-like protein (TIGR03299 family)